MARVVSWSPDSADPMHVAQSMRALAETLQQASPDRSAELVRLAQKLQRDALRAHAEQAAAAPPREADGRGPFGEN